MEGAAHEQQPIPESPRPVAVPAGDRARQPADQPADIAGLVQRVQHAQGGLGPTDVMQLQRLIGNRAVTRVLTSRRQPPGAAPGTAHPRGHPAASVVAPAGDQVVQRVVALPNAAESALLGQVTTFLQNQKNLIASRRQRQQASRIVNAWYVVAQGAHAAPPTTPIATYLTNNAPHPDRVSTQSVITIFNNVNPALTFGQVPNLVPHLNPLFQALANDIAGGLQGPGEGVGHQYTSGNPGQPGNAECRRAGNVTNMTFAQINAAATNNGGQIVIDEIGRNLGARSRLLWRWNDRSELVIDLPGMHAHETYEVSYTPHAHLIAPDGVHLSAAGVGVPTSSQPAHIIINWKEFSLKNFIHSQQGSWHYIGH